MKYSFGVTPFILTDLLSMTLTRYPIPKVMQNNSGKAKLISDILGVDVQCPMYLRQRNAIIINRYKYRHVPS